MTTKRLLNETSSAPLTRSGESWAATFITPGTGSSGTYSEDMLASFAASAFPAGTKHWFNHPTDDKKHRDPRDQWGVSAEDARFEPGVGIVGKIKVLPHWKTVVDSLAEAGQADLSIWAMGESDDDGNVIALHADRQNSVDLVGYPGRPGSALTSKMIESARSAFEPIPPATSAGDTKKEVHMTPEEKALIESLLSKVTALVTAQEAANAAAAAAQAAEASAEAVEAAKTEAVARAVEAHNANVVTIDAIEGLLPSQKTALLAASVKGEDITPLVESAKAVITEFKTVAESEDAAPAGRVLGEGADFTINGWSA